jgi:16S rRNA G966 N2-methylase RsmD
LQTDNSSSITDDSIEDTNKADTKELAIRINDEYNQLISPLTSEEYEILKKSIKKNKGNVVPIIVNRQGVILDGHHRYKICKELGIDPKIEIKEFADSFEEKEFIININRNRRQLNTSQIVILALKLEEIEREKAKKRSSQAGKMGTEIRWKSDKSHNYGVGSHEPIPFKEKGKTTEIIAKKMGLSPTTFFRGKKILEEGSEEQKKKFSEGKIPINKIYNEYQKSKKRDELLNLSKQDMQSSLPFQDSDYENNNNNNNTNKCYRLLKGDLSEKGNEISDESIDLIFTDPPYSTENIQIYSKLGSLASRVLKPGSSLITYIGQHNLPEIVNLVSMHNLKYWWPIAVTLGGSTKPFFGRGVVVLWKPLLWFVKGEKLSLSTPVVALNDYLYDLIESKPSDKILHPWQQSTVEPEYVINKLTIHNQIVLDPLMGSGTTGIATLNLNRKFIGIEKENDKFKIAEARLANHVYTQKIDSINLANNLANTHCTNKDNDSICEFNLPLKSDNKVELS